MFLVNSVCTIMNVSTLVSDLMATSDAARGMETFLEDAVCIIQARYICHVMSMRKLQ
jgi:hypothetical protein